MDTNTDFTDTVCKDPDGNLLVLGDDGFAASFIGGKWVKGNQFTASESFLMLDLLDAAAKAASSEARTALAS